MAGARVDRRTHLSVYATGMKKNQKQIVIVVGGLVALYLLYRYYQANNANAAAGAAAPNTSASDYAGLAGQEQSDVAGLQSQNAQLGTQEQSDVQALNTALGTEASQEQSDIAGVTSQEQSDVGGLAGVLQGLETQVASIPDYTKALNADAARIKKLQSQVHKLAIGEKKGTRGHVSRTHKSSKPKKTLVGSLKPSTGTIKRGTPTKTHHKRRRKGR
jgi:hypothetical protein